jgi:hypothetical protein
MQPSPDALEDVLRRMSIPRGQVTLLKALYDAEDEFVSRERLVEEIRWGNADEFRGLLAAFSNRVNNTPGFEESSPGYVAFVEKRTIEGERHFRLRPAARRAVERVPALMEAIGRPMEELLEWVTVEPASLSLAEKMDREDGGEAVSQWSPQTLEDRLLLRYAERVGGTIVTEVETGGSGPGTWPDDAGRRRIDGLRIVSDHGTEICSPDRFTQSQLRDLVADRHVEVIEVKKNLNRGVIGQAIAGRDLFRRDYAPATVEPVALCQNHDSALAWVCRRNGIRVEILEA